MVHSADEFHWFFDEKKKPWKKGLYWRLKRQCLARAADFSSTKSRNAKLKIAPAHPGPLSSWNSCQQSARHLLLTRARHLTETIPTNLIFTSACLPSSSTRWIQNEKISGKICVNVSFKVGPRLINQRMRLCWDSTRIHAVLHFACETCPCYAAKLCRLEYFYENSIKPTFPSRTPV